MVPLCPGHPGHCPEPINPRGLVFVAALDDTSGMGLSWGEWIRFALAPLIIALIAALVATRNARKTPHERLKNLVDIQDKMPSGLDSRSVVEAAIARELVDFDRRIAADQWGFLGRNQGTICTGSSEHRRYVGRVCNRWADSGDNFGH